MPLSEERKEELEKAAVETEEAVMHLADKVGYINADWVARLLYMSSENLVKHSADLVKYSKDLVEETKALNKQNSRLTVLTGVLIVGTFGMIILGMIENRVWPFWVL